MGNTITIKHGTTPPDVSAMAYALSPYEIGYCDSIKQFYMGRGSNINDSNKAIRIDEFECNTLRDINFDLEDGEQYALGLKWTTINSKNPYIGYASDQRDGTFLLSSLTGTNYASGLAIEGSSNNLLWKGKQVAVVDNINLTNLGITASSTELNYIDGVTSNVQTQLNNKLPLAGGTLNEYAKIRGTVPNSSWHKGRANSLLAFTNSATATAYFPLIDLKSQNGDWSVGTLADGLNFVYTTDTNYSNNNNETKRIYFNSEGYIYQSGYNVPSLIHENGYWGLGLHTGTNSDYLRTPSSGIIPYKSGGASAVGTSQWPFSSGYFKTLYVNGGSGHDSYYSAVGDNHVISFGIGSGGTNRGIWDSTRSHWSFYNDSSHTYIQSPNALHFNAYKGESYGSILIGAQGTDRGLELKPATNNTCSLGWSSGRWKYLYVNKIYTTNSVSVDSDKRLKKDISYDLSSLDKVIDSMKPVTYKLIVDDQELIRFGFIAQDVEQAFIDAGLNPDDYAFISKDETENGVILSLGYTETNALLWHRQQQLEQEIEQLKNKLS